MAFWRLNSGYITHFRAKKSQNTIFGGLFIPQPRSYVTLYPMQDSINIIPKVQQICCDIYLCSDNKEDKNIQNYTNICHRTEKLTVIFLCNHQCAKLNKYIQVMIFFLLTFIHFRYHTNIYLRNVGPSVCLFVCLFVCLSVCPPPPLRGSTRIV